MNNFTIVTGLWDLGRGNLKEFTRTFDHYLESFGKLLGLDFNMCIFVPVELADFVAKRRKPENTKVYIKSLEDIKNLVPFDSIQNIRTNRNWYSQKEWLSSSPQANLEYYNPVVMSKMLFVEQACKDNPFNTDYFFWLDGGITNTVGVNELEYLKNLPLYMEENDDKFLFLSFPYDADDEVHGFELKKFNKFCGEKSEYVCRGGFFGGHKKDISKFADRYSFFLKDSLDLGVMGTEECILTILAHRYEDEVNRFQINYDGLIYPFFEHLSRVKLYQVNNVFLIPYDKKKDVLDIKTSVYVLTYNSPAQFQTLIESYNFSEPMFMSNTRKILVDNSTDRTTYAEYNRLCKQYGFEHIKKEDNLGICGGRQFVAEHFNESDSEYYIFLEDDMNLNRKHDATCHLGFSVYIEDLYKKSLSIIHKEQYDFLKLSFSEFYGSNETQWAWYNIPQKVREKYFPNKPNLPTIGLDETPPKIVPSNRKRFKDLYYLEGEYYYCNWPLWMSKKGNAKVFLNVKWAHPNEQTWMSYVYQQQKRGKIRSAVLELSPIDHERFEYYPDEERKES